jgi:hypothetical protein
LSLQWCFKDVAQESSNHIFRFTSPGDIGHSVRQVVGVNLSAIALILDNTWTLCVSFDGATHNNLGYFDVRFSCGVCGKLYNFHLLALPIQNIAQTGTNFCNIVVKLQDLLYSGWKPKLHAITSDGAPVMIGIHSGINT